MKQPAKLVASALVAGTLLLPCTSLAKVDIEEKNTFTTTSAPLDVKSSADGKLLYVLTDDCKLHVYSDDGSLKDVIEVAKGTDRIEVAGLRAANIDNKIYLINTAAKTIKELAVEFSAEIDASGSPFLGDPGAPVTIAVFSDFE